MLANNSTNAVPQSKPERPADSPLFWHASGRWAKKIRGKFVYFGRGSHADALDTYNAQAEALHAGRAPVEDVDGLTVYQLTAKFLIAKLAQRDNGELSPRSYLEYGAMCRRLLKLFGRTRLVSDLRPADFAKLRATMAKASGPVRLKAEIVRSRTPFNRATKNLLLDKPIAFGESFSVPTAPTLRVQRTKPGAKSFDAAELHQLVDKAPTPNSPPTTRPSPPKPQPPGPEDCFSGDQLMTRVIPPIRWAVPDLIPEGGAVLAGRPKSGKSWLALHIALAIAGGGRVLDRYAVERGPVLYLALEDTPRRLQKRINVLGDRADLSELHFRTRWPALNEGGLDLLATEVAKLKPRLQIIDTLGKVRAHRTREDNAYAADYSFAGDMKQLADEHHTCLVALHHTSKSPRGDPVDEVSGTLGLRGAFDTILVLKRERHQNDGTLFLTGRDVEEQDVALTIDIQNQVWQSHGSAALRRLGEERKKVLLALRTHTPPGLKPRALADMLGKSPNNTRVTIWQMTQDGLVEADDQGRYRPTPHGLTVLNDLMGNQRAA